MLRRHPSEKTLTDKENQEEPSDPERYTVFRALFEVMNEKDKKRKHR
jgi:hypothetical protein